MPIPTTNVSLSDIQTEFGGTNPISLSEYYEGGSIIGGGVFDPNSIPGSGAISLGNFRDAKGVHSYTNRNTGRVVWQADTGWSIDYRNGKLVATLGYWSNVFHASAYSSELVLATPSSNMGSWNEVAQVELAQAGTIYYGTRDKLIKTGGIYFTGQGILSYTAGEWMMAARWNGNDTVTVFLNPTRYGTGDTGTSITMANLGASFEQVAGGGQTSHTFAFR